VRRTVFTLYVAEHAFATDDNGSGVAAAIRAAIASVDTSLASSVAFDAEADGVSIGAPDRSSLERAVRIAVDAGVVAATVLEMLDPGADEADEELWDVEPRGADAHDPDGLPWPMRPHAVTEHGVVGLLHLGFYRPDDRPWSTSDALAQAVRDRVDRQPWDDDVAVAVLHETAVTVEARTVERLDDVARLMELPGIAAGAAESFELLRTQPDPESKSLSDPPWAVVQDRKAGPGWSARGIADPGVRDVSVETIVRTYDLLEEADDERGGRLDVRAIGPELVIAGERREDVEWAVRILRATQG
jgi:hypothetical protein